jgi:hypothetical protein
MTLPANDLPQPLRAISSAPAPIKFPESSFAESRLDQRRQAEIDRFVVARRRIEERQEASARTLRDVTAAHHRGLAQGNYVGFLRGLRWGLLWGVILSCATIAGALQIGWRA